MSHRVFVDISESFVDNCADGLEFELDQSTSHHLKNVLRLSEGAQLVVVERELKQEYLGIISDVSKENLVKIKLLRLLDKQNKTPILKTLACGLPKGSHADQISEQVSQLGIEQIVFWSADRSVADPRNIKSKLERWQKIVEASARQSQQNSVPKVFYFESSNSFFSWLKNEINLEEDLLGICSLKSQAKIISEYQLRTGRAHLIIGPEGDFTDAEILELEKLEAKHISLGPLVLRVETAALVAAAMSLSTWGWR